MRLDNLFLLYNTSPKDYHRYMWGEDIITVRGVGVTPAYYWVVFQFEGDDELSFHSEEVHDLKEYFDLMPPVWETIG